MTNNEIRKAVDRIAQIKIYKKEEAELRANILAEFKRRGKNKINLGGPIKEDYVKLNKAQLTKYLVSDVYYQLIDSGKTQNIALGLIFQHATISKKEIREYLPDITKLIHPVKNGVQNQLSYRVSSDDKNMVRGIDL